MIPLSNITFPLGALKHHICAITAPEGSLQAVFGRLRATVAAWFTWERWGIEVDDLEPHGPADAVFLATRNAYKRAQELELEAAMAWRRFHELQATLATREAARELAGGAPMVAAQPNNVYTFPAARWEPESAVQRLRRRR